MAWRKISTATYPENWFHFTEAEPTIEGIWMGTRAHERFKGDVCVLQTDDGRERLFSLYTVLMEKLALVDVGDRIRITFLGRKANKSGVMYYGFDVEYEIKEETNSKDEEASRRFQNSRDGEGRSRRGVRRRLS